MILGFHFIFSAYGFWLPNDPRGSWSKTIRSYELVRFGPATKVATTRSVAANKHDHAKRLAAKAALKHTPVHFTGEQAHAIARGFAKACEEGGYRPLALAVLPDHAHLLLAYHTRHINAIAAHLKSKATRALTDAKLNPMKSYASSSGRAPSPWARKYWCPFIRSEQYMHTAVKYVNDNPIKAGLPRQSWKFVKPYTR
ncbi:MAG: transposase [Phycisphaeraceae bacterium]